MKLIFKAMTLSLLLALSPLALAQEAGINVNTADVEALAQLPGIGSTKATAIITDRDTNGPFQNADDLNRVSGIGDATVEGLRDRVVFE